VNVCIIKYSRVPWFALALCVIISSVIPTRMSADELPLNVRHEYFTGTRDVLLATDPARISLDGTGWFGDFASPYMHVFVNGRGPFTFLFDTGSSFTILSSKVVKAAALDVVSQVPGHHEIVMMKDVQVGPVRMHNYFAVVADGNEVDGIFGFNSFGNDYLTFDFAHQSLLVSSRPIRLRSPISMQYTLSHHCPNIDLNIDGKTLSTLIDTGDDAYAWEATSHNLNGLLLDHQPVTSAKVVNGQTGTTRTLMTSVDGNLRLGPLSSSRPAVAINESLPVPDIGIDILDQFVVEFDRVHKRVDFQRVFNGTHFTVPGEITAGFYISYRQPGRHVSDVLPELAANSQGMRPGDTIVSVNGKSAASLSYRQWEGLLRAGRPILVAWVHDGQSHIFRFPVVELR